MGLMSKIEDKLGKNKTDDQTTLGSDSNTYGSSNNSGLTGSSNTYGSGNTSGLTGSSTTGTHAADSSLRHPISSNQTSGLGHSAANPNYDSHTSNNPLSSNNQTSGLGHSGTDTGYGSSTSHNPLSSTTTTTNTTTSGLGHSSGSHNPLSSNTGTHGASGISSRDHVNRDGYGTEQHPSLRDNQTQGSVPGAYPGPAPNTAGPHNSDLLNKADPRVDSDNSKLHNQGNTYGSNTIGSTGGYGSHDSSRHGHSGAQGLVPGSQAENPSAIPTAGGQKVGSDTDSYGTQSSSTTRGNETVGPHKSDMLNKLDPRVDSDQSKLRDQDRNTYGTSSNTHGTSGITHGTSSHHNTTSGPHGSDNLNRADPRVDSDNSRSQHHYGRDAALGGAGVGAGAYGASHNGSHNTAGPHGSDNLNRADPRVDSDNSRAYGTSGHHNTTASPHSNDILNKADPRVDSDNSRAYGTTGHHNTTAGPHGSDNLNRADPRVDSDNSRSHHNYGRDAAIGGAGVGAGAYGTTHGPHSTDTANRVDPRVDSDNSRSHGYSGTNEPYGSSTHGTSSSHNTKDTVGPHKSDLLNKLDPRVDSDQSKLRQDEELNRGTGNLSLNDRHTGTTGAGYGSKTTTGAGYGGSNNTGMFDKSHGKKLGGAYEAGYEAGYRDALAHIEERRSH